jgi:peptidyl-prolyl cis-trans isomerase C/foldase protein PrsA
MEKEQTKKLDEALNKMYDEHIERLKKEFKVDTRTEVDATLRKQGTSLAALYDEFKNQVLASEYLRSKSVRPHVVGRQEMLAYYKEHSKEYNVPEQVRWQLLQITFEKHGGKAKAFNVLQKAVAELKNGDDFGKVARKYSDGPKADKGGNQPWTNPESLADQKTASVLSELEPGTVSPLIETHESFRLLRLIDRKKASRKPFGSVQDAIKQAIEEKMQRDATKKLLEDLYRQAIIESPYIDPEHAS